MSLLNIGTGTYYGDATYGSNVTGTSSTGYTRATSSTNFRTMSNNIASGYSSDIEIIQKYLKDGKTDKAIEKYESLFEDITTRNYRYSLTDSEVESMLKTSYENVTGTSLTDSIEKNTSGSFMTGFKQSIPIFGLFCNDVSEAEALAKITGDEVSTKDRLLEVAGWVTGTALTFLLGGGIFKLASSACSAALGCIKGVGIASKVASAFNFSSTTGKVVSGLAKTGVVLGTAATGVTGFAKTTDLVDELS